MTNDQFSSTYETTTRIYPFLWAKSAIKSANA